MSRLRILDSFGERAHNISEYQESLRRCNNDLYQVSGINHRAELGIVRAWSPLQLDTLYRDRDTNLFRFYDKIERLCDDFDVFIVNHENIYHPDFIKFLGQKIYTVLYTGDDPEGSYGCSQPYVWAFDHALCYAVYYDANTLMTGKLKQWGAPRADLKPFGYQHYHHDETLSEEILFAIRRDIDVLYVGGPYNKVADMLKLKKAFGKRFHLYGNWGGLKEALVRLKRHGYAGRIRPLPQSQFISTYQRAKIGINMHMSYGPSNLRMWHLPINGAMQITDNPAGTAAFFDTQREIRCYENGDLDEAIRLIDYYLTHERECTEIALAGHRKAKERYSFEQTFWNIMPVIEGGLKDKSQKLNQWESKRFDQAWR